MRKHVLVVDDDSSLRAVLDVELASRGYRVTLTETPEEVLAHLAAGEDDVDVVLTDLRMQGASGADLCAKIAELGRFVPTIVMTSFGSLDTAIAAIRAGAYDYVTKPLDLDDLAMTLDRAIEERALRAEVRSLRLGLDGPECFEEMVGRSPLMTKTYDLIARVARSDATVLITGESGTGKELVARAIHARSDRASGPFVAVNCAAMPEHLLESELFGHVKGAFTDARQSRRGMLSKASGGTLLLDEIGEMPLGMQTKLLRALQERKIRAVGGDEEISFDARILAATNRDLEEEVTAKRFREDLFYRINVVNVELPALRERGHDILKLAHYMLLRAQPTERRVIGFTPAAADAMLKHSWPGNVRELQNCIERAVALAEFDHIRVHDLPEAMVPRKVDVLDIDAENPVELITAAELERRYIARVMAAVKGNKTLAARILGCHRRTVYRKVRDTSAMAESDVQNVAQ
jgi:DNA-binding NtrC family response regulator